MKEMLSLWVGLVLATFISEDAACASGGLLASRGQISLWSAIIACGFGIFVSDLAIVLAGRAAARGSRARWLRWLTPSEAKLKSARQWFERRGGWVILASRFIPGTRSATCFVAGLLEVPMKRFTLIFLLASAVWTPVAVGLAYRAGQALSLTSDRVLGLRFLGGVALLLVLVASLNQATRLLKWRNRRLALGRWRRLTRWEFWPIWAVYLPVLFYLFWLALRHRSLTVFTAANPGIGAGGGLNGESKSEILRGLSGAGERIARWELIGPGPLAQRMQAVREFVDQETTPFPVVLKPDIGARGSGVIIARSIEQVESALLNEPGALIAQGYVPGVEFGVFYYRYPSQPYGAIFAITDKRITRVVGDGRRTLEEIILTDDRAVCMGSFFLRQFTDRLQEVLPAGATLPLNELGTHCRGALFLDGTALITPALQASVESVSRTLAGYYFGRYDVRASSVAAFQNGDFKVIELNGLTSEATSMYDPAHSVWFGWKTLCQQWRIAFEIGAENRTRGIPPLSVAEVLRLLRGKKPAVTEPEPAGECALLSSGVKSNGVL